jgi:hypothetical protein
MLSVTFIGLDKHTSLLFNKSACIRHQCRKTIVLSCHHLCLINTGVEKNELHLNIDYNFDLQMSLSKSKCLYSNNFLHFLKRAVLLIHYESVMVCSAVTRCESYRLFSSSLNVGKNKLECFTCKFI